MQTQNGQCARVMTFLNGYYTAAQRIAGDKAVDTLVANVKRWRQDDRSLTLRACLARIAKDLRSKARSA